ncbi:hypothetical protein [Parabacteroides sp.]
MKPKLLFCLLGCMLLICITACDKDNTTIEDEIPAAIKNDFSARYPSAKILSFQIYSSGIDQITFNDSVQNETLVSYVDENWKMAYTEIKDIQQLPWEVQSTFAEHGYRDAQNVYIYKTERNGMTRALYTLHFTYPWKGYNNMEHNVYINDDGLYLTTLRSIPNETRGFINLPEDHFKFIAEKYKGAEIRGYMNDGEHQYFILHNDTIKYVFFGGNVATNRGFWKETRYELSIDTPIPDNVEKILKHDNPDFTYTNLYYIESEDGNAYHFQDKNRDNELGYIIGENLQPSEDW